VEQGAVHEFGYAEVRARAHSALLRDIEDRVSPEGFGLLDVWMSDGDRVTTLPAGFKLIASTGDVPIAAMADEARGLYALQFHPCCLRVRRMRLTLVLAPRKHFESEGCHAPAGGTRRQGAESVARLRRFKNGGAVFCSVELQAE
jgi:GMP synthase-like glutamine amidotransferase